MRSLRTLALLAAGAITLFSQPHSISIQGVTAQEALVQVVAPDTTACTIQVSEKPDFSTLMPDVDPAVFPGSNDCKRLGTQISGNRYTIHLGARVTGDAADGTLVSRSLQQNTTYYVRVSFASGSSDTVQFTTEIKPLGDSGPDSLPYDPNGYNGWAWPTINYTPTGISQKYIDPLTGLQYQRMTGPGDVPYFQLTNQFFWAEDVSSDGGWKQLGDLATSIQSSTQGFVYTGAGGPSNALLLRPEWIPIPGGSHGYDSITALDDIVAYFAGMNDNASVCLTYRHGRSCIGTPINLSWNSTTTPSWVATENNFPQSLLSSWGNPRFTGTMLEGDIGSVSINGAVVTITDGSDFPVDVLQPGDSIQFFSNDWTNWTQEYTIASIQSPRQLTLTQSVNPVPSNPMFQLTNFGLMIWKQPGGSGTMSLVAANYNLNASHNFGTENQGEGATGCGTRVSLTKDQNGNPISPAMLGYLCTFVDSQGDQTQKLWNPSSGQVWSFQLNNKQGSSAPSTAAAPDYYSYDSNGFIDKCYYDIANSSTNCYPIQTQQTIPQELAAAHPEIDNNYYGSWNFQGSSYPYFIFTAQPQQNMAYWSCVIDVTQPPGPQQVQSCHNSWSQYPLRWETSHSFKAEFNAGNYLNAFQNFAMNSPNTPGAGQYTMQIVHVYSDGIKGTQQADTSLSHSFVDPNSCTALGVTNQSFLQETTQCILVDVVTEPVNTNPPSVDLSPLGKYPLGSKPGPWAHNANSCGGDGTTTNCWSYLQALQEGDWLGDAWHTIGEKFVVMKKTTLANGLIQLVLGRNPVSFGRWNGTNDHGNGWPLMAAPPLLFGDSCGTAMYSQLGQPLNWIIDTPAMWCAHQATWTTGSGTEIHVGVNMPLPDNLGGWYSGYGIRYGQIPGIWGKDLQYSQQGVYAFNGSFNQTPIGYQQRHPGGATWAAPPRESIWAVDGRPYGGAGGSNYSTPLWQHRFTLVTGQASTYKISPPADGNGNLIYQPAGSGPIWYAAWDIKNRAVHAWSGFHNLRNLSAPASVISDGTPYARCYALAANQCVSGSSAGDMYVSVPTAQLDGTCYAGDGEINTPCVTPAGPELATNIQFAINLPDPLGRWWRNLGMVMNGPGRTNNFANIHANPQGDYVFGATNWGDGRRSDVFAVTLPPWPNYDAVQRNWFVPVTYSFYPTTAISVRARFGYLEYGRNATNLPLYCSGEFHDECTTAPANTDAYAFASEPQQWQSCAANSKCTVTIPAQPSRILNYVIDTSTDGGKTWTATELHTTAVH